MTNFDASLHPRETTGRFTTKHNSAPTGQLLAPASHEAAVAEAAELLTPDELIEMAFDDVDYDEAEVDTTQIRGREYHRVSDPTAHLTRTRPVFTAAEEKEYAVAVADISRSWRVEDVDARSQAILAGARRIGALGPTTRAANDAYARAIVLNESGGYLDEEQVRHTLDAMEAKRDVIEASRAFGYPPEQFITDLAHAARSASSRARQADAADVGRAAIERKRVLDELTAEMSTRLDRGWSTRKSDLDDLYASYRAAKARLDEATTDAERVTFAARRDAYRYAIDKINRDI